MILHVTFEPPSEKLFRRGSMVTHKFQMGVQKVTHKIIACGEGEPGTKARLVVCIEANMEANAQVKNDPPPSYQCTCAVTFYKI